MYRHHRILLVVPIASLWVIGCAQPGRPTTSGPRADNGMVRTSHESTAPPDLSPPMTSALDPQRIPEAELLSGPQSLDSLIRRALMENRTVQAAYHNVQSLRHRIPRVTALDDPVLSNTIFPIPSVAPQYSLMGYNPYNVTLAQQFPWFGTLGLRGIAADRDVQVAIAELAAAQLDTVAAVKRAYANLYASTKTAGIYDETREILEDFRELARERVKPGGSEQDVRRAEILIAELDREVATNLQFIAASRSALARQAHLKPSSEIEALPELPLDSVPEQFDRLFELAIAARPELKGRIAAVARDEAAVELARKQSLPNVTLGLTYMAMEKTNAMDPAMAGGMPNIGLFVAFNVPVNRAKYRAGIAEAQERAIADSKLHEAEQDEAAAEIQDLLTQAKVQRDVLNLLRDRIQPRAKETLRLARSDYARGNVDYATVQSALREVLQVRLQVAQVEAELFKALASLERSVGTQFNERGPQVTPSEKPSIESQNTSGGEASPAKPVDSTPDGAVRRFDSVEPLPEKATNEPNR